MALPADSSAGAWLGSVAPMSTPAAERRHGGLIDRRLTARVAVTRRYLAGAVAVGLVGTACIVAQAVLLATVIERALLHRASLAEVTPQLGGLAAAFVVRAICIWLGEVAAQRTSATVTSVLRRQLLRKAIDLGPAWLSGERSGELSLSATRGISALDAYFGRFLPQAVLAGLAPVAILAWVGVEDWVSLLVLLGVAALVPVAMIYFGRKSGAETRRQWRRLSSLAARFLDLVEGLPTLRAFGRQSHGRREVAEATEGLRQTTIKTLRVAFLSALAMEFLAGIGTGLVAMVLGLRLLDGTLHLYTALAILLVSPEVFLPLRRAGAEFHASTEGQAAAERILDILDLPEHQPAHEAEDHPEKRRGRILEDPSKAAIRLASVTISYPGRAVPAVRCFDLEIAPGEHVALLGPSGAGKSTLLGLLLGFFRPDDGAVTVGGVDLETLTLPAWRRSLAWVPQRPHFFTGTIAENLSAGSTSGSDQRLWRAVEMVGLTDMLAELPDGLDTMVGGGGLTPSAGELQRLAIARAVLRDAPVVLLDEPVAHLDASTEGRLHTALSTWLDARTVLVAAHRPQLVDRIDRAVFLSAHDVAGRTARPDGAAGADGAARTAREEVTAPEQPSGASAGAGRSG